MTSPSITLDGVAGTIDAGPLLVTFPPLPVLRQLKLVSLYPEAVTPANPRTPFRNRDISVQPPIGDVYAFSNLDGADFDTSFSRFSLSVWCCEFVTISTPGMILAFSPSQASVQFVSTTGNLLMTGTFVNPQGNNAPDLYHVMFSIDTMAQTYTFRVGNDQWTPTVQWLSTGSITNVAA